MVGWQDKCLFVPLFRDSIIHLHLHLLCVTNIVIKCHKLPPLHSEDCSHIMHTLCRCCYSQMVVSFDSLTASCYQYRNWRLWKSQCRIDPQKIHVCMIRTDQPFQKPFQHVQGNSFMVQIMYLRQGFQRTVQNIQIKLLLVCFPTTLNE